MTEMRSENTSGQFDLGDFDISRRGFLGITLAALVFPSLPGCQNASAPAQQIDFPIMELTGTPLERGQTHGRLLRTEIAETLEYYLERFTLKPEDLKATAQRYGELIARHLPANYEEIIGIAKGAGLEPWQVVAINARTELLNKTWGFHECSTISLPEGRILAENWDWASKFLSLVRVARVEISPTHRFASLIEPGMLGKIGMSNAGIGVTLNFLPGVSDELGIPIHLLLRRALEAKTIQEAVEGIRALPRATGGAITLADKNGHVELIELCGKEMKSADHSGVRAGKSNHFELINDDKLKEFEVEGSRTRKARIDEILKSLRSGDLADAKKLLSDEETECPIYKLPFDDEYLGECCTIASIVMNLCAGELLLRKGGEKSDQFKTYKLT